MRLALFPLLALLPLVYPQSPSAAPPVSPSADPTTPPNVPTPVVPTTPPPSVEPTRPPSSDPVTTPPPSTPASDSISQPISRPVSQPISDSITTTPPSSVPSANASSSSANVTISANSTSSAITPNATANATQYDDLDAKTFYLNRDNDLLLDDVDMDLGVAAFAADEQILTLAYMANINQSSCTNLANQYAAGASPELRRHYADLEYARRKRKRATYSKRCLAITYEIPVYVHWVLPKGASPSAWISKPRLDTQMAMAKDKLTAIGATLNLKRSVYWDSENANKFSSGEWDNASKEYLGFIANAKSKLGATGSRNLHIFIVSNMGGRPGFTTLGRANFPGKARNAKLADCVVIARMTLPKVGADGKKANSEDTLWSTLPHEVGHWLGLIHLHDNGPGSTGDGCSGNGDQVAGTLKYRNGQAYGSSCGGTDMGPNGLYETNIMSYADGVKFNVARFIPEQRVRATVGWLIRRDGLSSGVNTDIRRVYTSKDCDAASKALGARSTRFDGVYPDSVVGPHKRMLSVRATAEELQRFCARTDLVVADHDFSPISEGGIYNPASVPLPGDPSQPLPDVPVGNQVDVVGATTGSNFEQAKQQVEARVESGGPVDQPYVTPAAVTVTAVPTSGTGGGGKSGAMRTAGWVSGGLGMVGVVAGGLMVL